MTGSLKALFFVTVPATRAARSSNAGISWLIFTLAVSATISVVYRSTNHAISLQTPLRNGSVSSCSYCLLVIQGTLCVAPRVVASGSRNTRNSFLSTDDKTTNNSWHFSGSVRRGSRSYSVFWLNTNFKKTLRPSRNCFCVPRREKSPTRSFNSSVAVSRAMD